MHFLAGSGELTLALETSRVIIRSRYAILIHIGILHKLISLDWILLLRSYQWTIYVHFEMKHLQYLEKNKQSTLVFCLLYSWYILVRKFTHFLFWQIIDMLLSYVDVAMKYSPERGAIHLLEEHFQVSSRMIRLVLNNGLYSWAFCKKKMLVIESALHHSISALRQLFHCQRYSRIISTLLSWQLMCRYS